MTETHYPPCRPLTKGPSFHYFGYYDKFPYDATGRYILTLETDFMTRPPTPDDVAGVGLVDTQGDGTFEYLDATRAFNWQQGTHLQWLPTAPESTIIYNVWDKQGYRACVNDIKRKNKRLLSRPIYALSRSGTEAITPNFSRIHDCRPGYGYNGIPDPNSSVGIPENDGIWRVDIDSGDNEFIISIAQATEIEPEESFQGAKHWFNHLEYSTDDSRILFLHRWTRVLADGRRTWYTRMLTANPDGSDIYLLNKDEMTSHFDWRDGNHVLAWARRLGVGDYYFLFTDKTQDVEIIGDPVLTCDGHCSYSPDRRWILTDTYPQGPQSLRTLILFNVATGERTDIGAFHSPPELQGEIRCDLHPRWSRDGQKVCFDSMHEGPRQVYEIDISGIV